MLTTSRIPLLLALLLLGAACSKEPKPVTAPGTPLVEQNAADPLLAPGESFRGSFAPGGVAATYNATFKQGRIQRLVETRNGTSQTATYEFLGARLIKYSGAALKSNDHVELELDPSGKLIRASAGDKEASQEEVTAIRDRAQSLRSHAVSQYEVKGHDRV